MYGVLDLTWKPSANSTAPAAGQSSALVRGDTYAHVIEFWNDAEQTDPLTIDGTVTAQLRAQRLSATATVDAPLAEFTVGVVDNAVTVTLAADDTLELPSSCFWDLQQDVAGVITTLLAGRVKVLDDVTRAS